MTNRSMLVLVAAMIAGTSACAPKMSELASEQDRLSYALGMGQGDLVRRYAAEVDLALYDRGMKDAIAGSNTLLTEAEVRTILVKWQTGLRQQAAQKLAAGNQQKGEAYRAANRDKTGVVEMDSGLQYIVLEAGDGAKPAADDTVLVHYRGTLVDGTEFDNSFKRGRPVELPLGKMIRGWTEALQQMTVGSKWQIVIPPNLAYGERHVGRTIGPNSTLIFEIELLSIVENKVATEEEGTTRSRDDQT